MHELFLSTKTAILADIDTGGESMRKFIFQSRYTDPQYVIAFGNDLDFASGEDFEEVHVVEDFDELLQEFTFGPGSVVHPVRN